jgi:hypothetical protein
VAIKTTDTIAAEPAINAGDTAIKTIPIATPTVRDTAIERKVIALPFDSEVTRKKIRDSEQA